MLSEWRDRDLPELDRARSLLLRGADADAVNDNDDDLDGLVDLLNEPLAILPRLAGERLRRRGGVVVAADASAQRLRRCRHDVAAFMADADTALTGRSMCVDCGSTVVAFDDVTALARELEGCALFRGPVLPWPSSWLRIDERRVDQKGRRITIGGGPADDVTNAGLPAGALSLGVGDDVIDVRCAPGLTVVAPSPGWAWPRPPTSQRRLVALARPDLRAPLLTDLVVFRDGDPTHRAVTVTVDAADPFAVEIVWRGFSARELLRVGDVVGLAFDGSLRALRSGSQVLIQTGHTLIDLPPGERVDLPLGTATATWRGRQLEVVGCPPPVSRAPQVNLLASAAATALRRP